jgi:hypothetical protein
MQDSTTQAKSTPKFSPTADENMRTRSIHEISRHAPSFFVRKTIERTARKML